MGDSADQGAEHAQATNRAATAQPISSAHSMESQDGLVWKGPYNSSHSNSCHGWEHLPLDHAAPSPIQPGWNTSRDGMSIHSHLCKQSPAPQEPWLPLWDPELTLLCFHQLIIHQGFPQRGSGLRAPHPRRRSSPL